MFLSLKGARNITLGFKASSISTQEGGAGAVVCFGVLESSSSLPFALSFNIITLAGVGTATGKLL